MHAQLGQIRNKIQKEQTPPAHNITKEVGRPPKPPLQQTLGPVPTLTPFEGPVHPCLKEAARTLVTCFAPSCGSMSPSNSASPEFLIWPLLNFY